MDTQNSIQDNLHALATSPDIFEACEKIGQRLGLHIDQVGTLDSQIRQILLGKAKSSNFISDIKKYLEIDDAMAQKIAVEVNKDVFEAIKRQLQSNTHEEELTPMTVEKTPDHSDLNRAGNFTVTPQKREAALPTDISHDDKARLISNIETMANDSVPANLPTGPGPKMDAVTPPVKPPAPPEIPKVVPQPIQVKQPAVVNPTLTPPSNVMPMMTDVSKLVPPKIPSAPAAKPFTQKTPINLMEMAEPTAVDLPLSPALPEAPAAKSNVATAESLAINPLPLEPQTPTVPAQTSKNPAAAPDPYREPPVV